MLGPDTRKFRVRAQSFWQDPGKIPDWEGKKAQLTGFFLYQHGAGFCPWVACWQVEVETQKGKNLTWKDVARMTKKKYHIPIVHWHKPGNHHQNPRQNSAPCTVARNATGTPLSVKDAPTVVILWQSLISTYNTTSLEHFQYGIGLAPIRRWSKDWNVEMFYVRMVLW